MELVLPTAELEVSTGATVGVWIGGGMTLRVIVAPHWAKGVPLGQQPALVQ